MTHVDHFGRPIEIGDIRLTAKAGGKFFDTQYYFVIVTSKTSKLVRVHQMMGHLKSLMLTQDEVKEELSHRCGRLGGKTHPQGLVRTGVNIGLTEAEMLAAIKSKPNGTLTLTSAIPSWFP